MEFYQIAILPTRSRTSSQSHAERKIRWRTERTNFRDRIVSMYVRSSEINGIDSVDLASKRRNRGPAGEGWGGGIALSLIADSVDHPLNFSPGDSRPLTSPSLRIRISRGETGSRHKFPTHFQREDIKLIIPSPPRPPARPPVFFFFTYTQAEFRIRRICVGT